MIDNKSQAWSDALAAIQRSTRAAEERLDATEAEMRFASDIAAGIYTPDMIPAVMDEEKIMELVDYYSAEAMFEEKLACGPGYAPAPDVRTTSEQEIAYTEIAKKNSSPADPPKQQAAPESVSPAKPKRRSRHYYFLRLKPWLPAIVILSLFVITCAYYSLDLQRNSSGTPAEPTQTDTPDSHAVDYKAQYVGSVNGAVFHLNTCRYADSILKANRVYYSSIADAVADGRSKCLVCLGDSAPSTSSTSSSGLFPITPPQNGHIFHEDGSDRFAPLTVKTRGEGYYLIKLRDHYSGDEVLTFFVRGGETAEIDAPVGEFDLSYSYGEEWYGYFSKFGDGAYCAKADEIFKFYEEDNEVVGWTVTLYAVSGGDLDFDEIPADQF